MGIHRMYNTKVMIKRLAPDDDDADREGYVNHIVYLYCYLHAIGGPAASALGTIYQPYKMYTEVDQDIKSGDLVINDRTNEHYLVKDVVKHEMGINQYLDITMERREAAEEE